MIVSIWHGLNINTYNYLFCTLAYPFFCVSLLFVFLLWWSPIRSEYMWFQCQRHLWRMQSHLLGWWKVSVGVVVSEWFVLRIRIGF